MPRADKAAVSFGRWRLATGRQSAPSPLTAASRGPSFAPARAETLSCASSLFPAQIAWVSLAAADERGGRPVAPRVFAHFALLLRLSCACGLAGRCDRVRAAGEKLGLLRVSGP